MENRIASSPVSLTELSQHENECLNLLSSHIDSTSASILATAMHLAPYLDQLYRKNINLIPQILNEDTEKLIETVNTALIDSFGQATTNDQAMKAIRVFRQNINTIVTVLDILDRVSVADQIAWLSHAADLASTNLANWLEMTARQTNRLKTRIIMDYPCYGQTGV